MRDDETDARATGDGLSRHECRTRPATWHLATHAVATDS